MGKKHIILLFFSCIYYHYAQSAVPQPPIIPPAIFEPFNPFTMPPIGLINLGNSCYMNAMLQCLYRMSPITKPLVDFTNLNTEDELLSAYRKFVNTYTYRLNANQPIRPIDFYKALIDARQFREGTQQDSQEALNAILDILPLELAENYKLPTTSTITCAIGHQSRTDTTENMLILPTTNVLTLDDYLQHYFDIEQMNDAQNLVACSHCNNRLMQATKKISLRNLPNYLIIKINLEKNMRNRTIKQLLHPIIPLDNLDMSAYLQEGIVEDHLYEFFGCVWHIGASLRGGHYVATIKANEEWYLCNDSCITHIDSPEGNLAIGYLPPPLSKENVNPYILFYKKKGLASEENIDHAKYPENEELQTPQVNPQITSSSDNAAIAGGIAVAIGAYILQALSDWWSQKTEILDIKSALTELISGLPENEKKKIEFKEFNSTDSDIYTAQDQYLLITVDENDKKTEQIFTQLKNRYELIGYIEPYKSFLQYEKLSAHIKWEPNQWIKINLKDKDSYEEESTPKLNFKNIKLLCFKLKSESSASLNLVNLTTTLGVLS